MLRKAFLMSVHPGKEEEYIERHDSIWPELVQTLRAHGARNYTIFFDSATGRLFAYVEIESEERWAGIARTDICQKWWAAMKGLMPSNPDNSPVAHELREVFHLA